jgi:Na+/phosphate symporter
MVNTLLRIGEPMKEHTDNSFSPLTEAYRQEFSPYCNDVYTVLCDISQMIRTGDYSKSDDVSQRAKYLKYKLATLRKEQTMRLHQKSGSLKMDFVYLNLIQESHELLSEVRNLLRGSIKLFAPFTE